MPIAVSSLLLFISAAALAAFVAAHVYFRSVRNARHRTNEYHFAHFSRITARSKWFFPLFALARPQKFTLHQNESLWIPKGWWHWVVSDPETIAISYWCPKTPGVTVPFTFPADGSEILTEVQRALDGAQDVSVWNSSTDTIVRQPIEKKDSRCIITLPGYGPDDNRDIRARIAALASESPISFWNGCEELINVNLWVALGKHDTGLHYDDNDGVLRVLQGRKSVLLYPPEQRTYLAPLCVLPEWAKQRPIAACYNFTVYPGSRSGSQPSLRAIALRNHREQGCPPGNHAAHEERHLVRVGSEAGERPVAMGTLQLFLQQQRLAEDCPGR